MKKIRRYTIISALTIFIGMVCFVLFLQIINYQGISWRVKITGLNLPLNNVKAAQEILENKWNEFNNQEIVIINQENNWSVKLTDLGFILDSQTTIQKAYQVGRHSNIFINFKEQLVALFGYYNLEPVYQLDQGKFQEKTDQLFKDIERPAQNASLVFNQEIDDFSLVHSTKGQSADRNQLLFDLSERLKSFSNQSIDLVIIFDDPQVTNDEVDSAKTKAQQILANQPYQLSLDKRYWTINKERLIDWIIFKPIKDQESENQILGFSLDNDKIKTYLIRLAVSINSQAANAQIETESNRAIVFIPAQTGYQVKTEETINQFLNNLSADPPINRTNILAVKSEPEITLEQTNQLGIYTLIGQGVSNFYGSPKNRIHNIKNGANKFNGLILSPDEEFSFNNLLGGSGPEEGFLLELVIKENKTIPEYGGGLCQISTTMFRAAVNSGLKITQRSPHAFPVEYYYPHGFDATIYDPQPDLKFINNTPDHLLIQAVVEEYKLYINFFGTDDNRQIKILGPYVLEKKEDGSMKTVLTQEVYQNGEIADKQVFYSNYQSPDLFPRATAQEE